MLYLLNVNKTTHLLSHAGTERAEHIQIIITFTQKADNVIPEQLGLLVNI